MQVENDGDAVNDKLTHLRVMTGPLGLYQHARGRLPRLEEGYCTDDNTRAVTVLVHSHADDLLEKCWQFTVESQMPAGNFRNFRTIAGLWLDDAGSDDTQAHTARALAAIISHSANLKYRHQAERMLTRLLPHLQYSTHPRGWAETLIAISTLPEDWRGQAGIQEVAVACAAKLHRAWQAASTPHWPWFEKELTYANALLPHGLLAAAALTGNHEYQTIAAKAAAFLVESTIVNGMFRPVGNKGWYQEGSQPAVYDQQPLEAATTLELLLALRMSPDPTVHPTPEQIAAPYLWFLGHNRNQQLMADPVRGACYDGLNADSPNPNQGAESTLAYLWAEILMHSAPPAITSFVALQRRAVLSQKAGAVSPT